VCSARDCGVHAEAGIGKDGEVRMLIDALDGIGALFVACDGCGGEVAGKVSAGGESPDADAVGPEAIFRCVAAEVANGAGAIEHGDGVAVFRRNTVLQNERSDSAGGEPPGFRGALLFHDLMDIAAAGHHDDGRMDAHCGRRIVIKFRDVCRRVSPGHGRFAGPEIDDPGVSGRRRVAGERAAGSVGGLRLAADHGKKHSKRQKKRALHDAASIPRICVRHLCNVELGSPGDGSAVCSSMSSMAFLEKLRSRLAIVVIAPAIGVSLSMATPLMAQGAGPILKNKTAPAAGAGSSSAKSGADAKLINIPVVVHDKHGAVMPNLPQDDFVLWV